MRTLEQREKDRASILTVLENAQDWVVVGWVTKRVTGLSMPNCKNDLANMTNDGTLEKIGRGGTGFPHRYAIKGKFKKSQLISERPELLGMNCKRCGTDNSSRWNRTTKPEGPLCNTCYPLVLKAAKQSKRTCVECFTTDSPQWRLGGTTCNACAIRIYRAKKNGVEVPKPKKRDFTKPQGSKRWLPAEIQQLIGEVTGGSSVKTMAEIHGRTEKAIESRLYLLSRKGAIHWGTRSGLGVLTEPVVTEPVKPTASGDLLYEIKGLMGLREIAILFVKGEATLSDLFTAIVEANGDLE